MDKTLNKQLCKVLGSYQKQAESGEDLTIKRGNGIGWDLGLWGFSLRTLKKWSSSLYLPGTSLVLAWKVPYPRKTLNCRGTGWLQLSEGNNLTDLRFQRRVGAARGAQIKGRGEES